jgi:hypothetical protein
LSFHRRPSIHLIKFILYGGAGSRVARGSIGAIAADGTGLIAKLIPMFWKPPGSGWPALGFGRL